MTWRECFTLPDRRPPWKWAEESLVLKNSPFGKRFKIDHTPWLAEPLETFTDNNVKEQTHQCCVQGAKTILIQIAAAWAIRFYPAPMMINLQTDPDASDFAKERFNPMLQSCAEIRSRLPTDPAKRSTCFISLPDMFCLIQGANLSNLQSKSIRWLFNDEIFLWKAGLLDHARKRTTQFWNRRIVNTSTADEVGSDLDRAQKAGDQREYFLFCFKCGQTFWPKWSVIKYEKQEDWDFKLLKQSAYLECPHCQHRYEHTEANRRGLLSNAVYVPQNNNPTPGHVSFHWNALVLSPDVLSWGDLAVEWVKAEIEFNKGNETPRKEFITKRLAESWDQNRQYVAKNLPVVELSSRVWPEEKYRFMAVDVQESEFWVLVMACSEKGDDLVMWFGRAFSWAEVEAKQAEYNVSSRCVLVDSGYDTRKVYEVCAKNNWVALKGEDRAEFLIRDKGKTYTRPYSWPPAKGDPMMGTRLEGAGRFCSVIRWANPTVKDIAKRRRDGQAQGVKCSVMAGVSKEFNEHMFSERPQSEYDKRGKETRRWYRIGNRPNHGWDCYCMCIVGMCLGKVIGEAIPGE